MILMTKNTTTIAEGRKSLILKRDLSFFHIFNINYFSPFVISMSTPIQRKGPQARLLFGASTKGGVPISLAIRIPIILFILLIWTLKTLIQKGERWKITLLGLRSPLKHCNKKVFYQKTMDFCLELQPCPPHLQR